MIDRAQPTVEARGAALAKLRCRCGASAAVAQPGPLVCVAGHPFEDPHPPSGHRSMAEHIFDHPRFLGAKVVLLSRLNGIPRGGLDPLVADTELLDLGCGSYQYQYRPEHTRLRVGLDLAPRATALANRLYPASLHLQASLAEPLPFADRSFDVVLLCAVLHHLPRAIVPQVVREAVRVARQRVLIYDHTRSDVPWQRRLQQCYWDTFDGGDLYRSSAEWEQLLAGYPVVQRRRFGVMFKNVCLYRLEL